MTRVFLCIMSLAVAGCTPSLNTVGSPRPQVQRDVEGYAIASCLASQSEPYLKDQGDAWASVVVQRMKGDLDALVDIAEQVRRENEAGNMAVIRDETRPEKGKTLPLLHCGEIVDRPAVRVAIQKAIGTLGPYYEASSGNSDKL